MKSSSDIHFSCILNCRPGVKTFLDSHERTASRSRQAENGEGVNDEAHLFVGQQRVDENETHCGQQQQPHPTVQKAEGDEEERAEQGTGHRRVKIPQKGSGLLGRNRSRRTGRWMEMRFK